MSLPYQVEELIQIIELILNLYLTKEHNYAHESDVLAKDHM